LNQDISDDDFATILRYALISKPKSAISELQKKSLEVVASVSGEESNKILTVAFRNRIDGITQRLGAIDMAEAEEEISLFDWAAIAVDKQNAVESELNALRTQSESDRDTITYLRAELANLVQAKSEHEDQLLSKFALLLNEKKLKIRNQQRILSTARVDKRKLQPLQISLHGEQITTMTARSVKREAEDEAGDQADSDSTDGFAEAAAGPSTRASRRRGSSRETTPETETASEDEGMPNTSAGPPLPAANMRTNATSLMPERRNLTFAKTGEKRKASEQVELDIPQTSLGSDDETASEDDEL
jgi:DNA double-strand break repair and V(D)J recombination protein XRCC4